jgi:hypothetical protein
MCHYLSDPVLVLMVFIIGIFIPYPEAIEYGHSHAQRKPKNIDEGTNLVFGKGAPGHPQITFEHSFYF